VQNVLLKEIVAMPQIQVGDIIERQRQDQETTVLINEVWLRGRQNGDGWDRKYRVEFIGNCGRVGLRSLGAGSDLWCALFCDWSTFSIMRHGECCGSAEHYRTTAANRN